MIWLEPSYDTVGFKSNYYYFENEEECLVVKDKLEREFDLMGYRWSKEYAGHELYCEEIEDYGTPDEHKQWRKQPKGNKTQI